MVLTIPMEGQQMHAKFGIYAVKVQGIRIEVESLELTCLLVRRIFCLPPYFQKRLTLMQGLCLQLLLNPFRRNLGVMRDIP